MAFPIFPLYVASLFSFLLFILNVFLLFFFPGDPILLVMCNVVFSALAPSTLILNSADGCFCYCRVISVSPH